jgi:hypothetical protein
MECAGESVALDSPLEAGGAAAGPRPAPRGRPARDEDAVRRREPQQIRLRGDAPAADACARGRYSDASSAALSTGIPAGTSSRGATSASGETSGSSPSAAGSVTGAAESGVAGGGPPT